MAVVAAHGSGLANCIFYGPDTLVLEVAPDSGSPAQSGTIDNYWEVCTMVGMKYIQQLQKTVDQKNNMIADVQAIVSTLEIELGTPVALERAVSHSTMWKAAERRARSTPHVILMRARARTRAVTSMPHTNTKTMRIDDHFAIELVDRASGATLPEVEHNGKVYVIARPGVEFNAKISQHRSVAVGAGQNICADLHLDGIAMNYSQNVSRRTTEATAPPPHHRPPTEPRTATHQAAYEKPDRHRTSAAPRATHRHRTRSHAGATAPPTHQRSTT
eukprot:gene28123-31239_t